MEMIQAVRDSFAGDYAAARRLFVDAARARGGRIRAYPNPERGPEGEALGADAGCRA